jgi:hypothetical protein
MKAFMAKHEVELIAGYNATDEDLSNIANNEYKKVGINGDVDLEEQLTESELSGLSMDITVLGRHYRLEKIGKDKYEITRN